VIPVPVNLHLVVMVKAGKMQRPVPIRVSAISPEGTEAQTFESTLNFSEGGAVDQGNQLVVELKLLLPAGQYWFDIYVQDEWVTRIPLALIAEEQPTPESGE
jgi:hypothetical protein